jgi:Endodeoxyribonuclease RusA
MLNKKPVQQRETMFRFDDVMIVVLEQQKNLSFVVYGDPPVQQRIKVNSRMRMKPVCYDPSAGSKVAWRSLLRRELLQIGENQFPIFPDGGDNAKGLMVTMKFHMSRRRADYRTVKGEPVLKVEHQQFPESKDVDNMVKYLMDAMDSVLFSDDKIIVRVIAEKCFVPDNINIGPYTTISVENIM